MVLTMAGGDGYGGGGVADVDVSKVPIEVDLVEYFGLKPVLEELRSQRLRSTFSHYIQDIPSQETPIRPRCVGGSLVEVALQPAMEDAGVFDYFDERALREALALKEGDGEVSQPAWLFVDQPWDDADRKRRRRHRKKKKRRKKDGDEEADSDRKRKRRRREDDQASPADSDGDAPQAGDSNLSQT